MHAAGNGNPSAFSRDEGVGIFALSTLTQRLPEGKYLPMMRSSIRTSTRRKALALGPAAFAFSQDGVVQRLLCCRHTTRKGRLSLGSPLVWSVGGW